MRTYVRRMGVDRERARSFGAVAAAYAQHRPSYPREGVRWALFSSTVAGLVSAVPFWLARRRVREDMVS